MTKSQSMFLMILNGIFLLLNMFFMTIVPAPIVNLIAGIMSLGGLVCSYQMYINAEE